MPYPGWEVDDGGVDIPVSDGEALESYELLDATFSIVCGWLVLMKISGFAKYFGSC